MCHVLLLLLLLQSIHCACAILGQVNDLLGNKFKSAVLARLAGEARVTRALPRATWWFVLFYCHLCNTSCVACHSAACAACGCGTEQPFDLPDSATCLSVCCCTGVLSSCRGPQQAVGRSTWATWECGRCRCRCVVPVNEALLLGSATRCILLGPAHTHHHVCEGQAGSD